MKLAGDDQLSTKVAGTVGEHRWKMGERLVMFFFLFVLNISFVLLFVSS